MRILPFCLILSLCWIACSSPDKQADESTATVSEVNHLPAIEPAVADPPDAATRDMGSFIPTRIEAAGVELKMEMPEGFTAKPQGKNWIMEADNGDFQLKLSQTELNPTDVKSLWEEDNSGFSFRRFVLTTPNGHIIEVENGGKAEYHVDYVYQKDSLNTFRIENLKDRPFSELQATKMFHACRMLRYLNDQSAKEKRKKAEAMMQEKMTREKEAAEAEGQ
ncbi:MAG: hypothetical protein AAF206_26995 [Bacteroidota bacterium]